MAKKPPRDRFEAGIAPAPRTEKDVIERVLIRDRRLSYRALGVAVRLLSNAAGFKMTSLQLATERPEGEGRDAVRLALRELEAAGYLRREKRQLASGQWVTEQWVFDTPQEPRDKRVLAAVSDNIVPLRIVDPPAATQATGLQLVTRAESKPETPLLDVAPAPEIPVSGSAHPPAPDNPSSVREPTPEIPASEMPDTPTPEKPTPGGPASATPSVGKAVMKSSRCSTSKSSNRTTTGSEQSAALIWPSSLRQEEQVVVEGWLDTLELENRQGVLDEFAGAMASKSPPDRPLAWFRGLIQKAREGAFVPDLAKGVQEDRRRRQRASEEAELRRHEAAEREGRLRDPERVARSREALESARRELARWSDPDDSDPTPGASEAA